MAGSTATGASGTYNYLIDLVLQVPATRAMYLRRLRTLMDTFLQGQLAQVTQAHDEMSLALRCQLASCSVCPLLSRSQLQLRLLSVRAEAASMWLLQAERQPASLLLHVRLRCCLCVIPAFFTPS